MQNTWTMSVLLLGVLWLAGGVLQGSALSPNGTNVCSNTCQRTFKERVQSYKRCGLFGWRRCAHYTYQVVVRNETCYACCPGWLQSDSNNCRTQEPCPTGSAGIRSCADLPDGNYQSCDRCHMYSACAAGILSPHQPCCCGLVWDDESKRCEWKSKTCHQATGTTSTSTTSTEPMTPPIDPLQLTTGDPDGINCGPQSGCWVRYNFRYDDNWNDCHGGRYVRRSEHPFAKYVGVILCTEERYKIFLGDHLKGVFQNIADGNGDGRDHCEFVGGEQCHKGVRVAPGFWKSPLVYGFYRDEWGEEPHYGLVGRGWFPETYGHGPKQDTGRYYVKWYQCDVSIPGNSTVIDYVLTMERTLQAQEGQVPMTTTTSADFSTTKSMATTTSTSTMTSTERSTSQAPTSAPDTHILSKVSHRLNTPLEVTTHTPIRTSQRPSATGSQPAASRKSRHLDLDTGSGSGGETGSGTAAPTCDVISCPPPSVCVDLYGDDEDEPFSKCVCPPGMATMASDPSQCEEVDECESNPCQNGGQCLDRRGGYVCDCAPGWQGTHCQEIEFNETQRPLCNHCADYGRLAGGCSGRYCECRKGRYNTYTCLPEVSDCTVLRNQSSARGRPQLMIDRPVGVVYSCVPSERPRPSSILHQRTPPPAVQQKLNMPHPVYEVHALAIYRSTKGSVVVNVTWPREEGAGRGAESNFIPAYQSYVMLALSNYWPTSWTVVIPAWRQLSEVIVFSHAHRNTTVTVRRGSVHGGLVPVNTFHLHPASYPPGFGDDTHTDTNTPSMLEYLYNQYGTLASFTGTYQADSWQLRVGVRPKKTPRAS